MLLFLALLLIHQHTAACFFLSILFLSHSNIEYWIHGCSSREQSQCLIQWNPFYVITSTSKKTLIDTETLIIPYISHTVSFVSTLFLFLSLCFGISVTIHCCKTTILPPLLPSTSSSSSSSGKLWFYRMKFFETVFIFIYSQLVFVIRSLKTVIALRPLIQIHSLLCNQNGKKHSIQLCIDTTIVYRRRAFRNEKIVNFDIGSLKIGGFFFFSLSVEFAIAISDSLICMRIMQKEKH